MMNLRVLGYFLTVARVQNITKAAEILHITQPTLSRQLAQLEEELGVQLFDRTQHKLMLTSAGNLLVHRGKDIMEMVDKTETEIRDTDTNLSGNICFGAGELNAVNVLADLIVAFQEQHPEVTFDIFTNTTDIMQERMEKGLLDIALAVEPIDVTNYDYIELSQKEIFGVYMRKDSHLAAKEKIAITDLLGLPLLMPSRLQVRSQVLNWLSGHIAQINIVGTCNLVGNAVMLVERNDYYAVACLYDPVLNGNVCFRPLYPAFENRVYLTWRKGVTQSLTMQRFIQFARAYFCTEQNE